MPYISNDSGVNLMGKLYETSQYVISNKLPDNSHFARDFNFKIAKKKEAYDYDDIKQSITNIILTIMGERLFNVGFGSNLYGMLFNNSISLTENAILRHIIDRVLTLDNRVAIHEELSYASVNPDANSVFVFLSVYIKSTGSVIEWEEEIEF